MQGAKLVVLCVDDDVDVLDVLRVVLERAGFGVETAANKDEGLSLYKKRKPDAMIVDLMMEEVDSGIGFLEAVRVLGSIPPTYMLSSVGDALSVNIDRKELGVIDILQKPVNHEDLVRYLKSQLHLAT